MDYVVNEKGTLIKVDGELADSLTFPSNTVRIGKNLFSNKNIKEVFMKDSLKYIGEKSFYNCVNLDKLEMPGVIQIDDYAFANCKSLKEVELPHSLLLIKENAFSGCSSIKNIRLPENIKEIKKGTFDSCSELNDISFPYSLGIIGERAFANCINLKNVQLPNTVREIGENAFYNCSLIEEMELPENLERIKKGAFEKCSSLKKIIIKGKVIEIEADCFNNCYNLKEIRISDYSNITQPGLAMLNYYDYYLDTQTSEIVLTTEPKEDEKYIKLDYEGMKKMLNLNNKYNAIKASIMFKKEDLQDKELKHILFLINGLCAENINIDNYKTISSNLYNSKEFVNLLKHIGFYSNYENLDKGNQALMEIKMYNLFKFAYLIGAFSDDYKDRQKACEFIKNLFDKQILKSDNIYQLFNHLKFSEFNKELSRFVMNEDNFEKMSNIENDFVYHTLNDFNEIREYCRSNKGNQRYLMVTLDMAIKFRKKIDFEGVNLTNRDISEVVGKYTFDQSVFDEAVSIRNEYLKRREEGLLNDHILNEEIKGYSVFSAIDKIREDTLEDISNIMSNLNKVLNNKFSYEYLSKYDSDNFVLGKYCSCCAHLESIGYGIMKASILHPDCQNLVIRDRDGKIIAKSTLYINRSQGYGVFNNVEISNIIKGEKEIQMIYNCYLKAVNDFIISYNKKNPNNPLMQINVGMDNNDLAILLEKYNEKEENLLEGLNFTPFGKVNKLHSGDWQHKQRVLWKNENGKGKENNGR